MKRLDNDTWMQIIKEDGKHLKPVIRNTEKGQSDYANRAWNKYGDSVTVEQYHFEYRETSDEEPIKIVTETIWHA